MWACGRERSELFAHLYSQAHDIHNYTTRGWHARGSGAVSARHRRQAWLQLQLQLRLCCDELLGAGAPTADSLLQLLRTPRCGCNGEASCGTRMNGGGGAWIVGRQLTCSAALAASSSHKSCCAESIDHESGPSATVSHPADDIRSESDASRFCAASRSSCTAASFSHASACASLSLAFSVVRRSSSSCCGVGPAGAGVALFLLDLTSRFGTSTVRTMSRHLKGHTRDSKQDAPSWQGGTSPLPANDTHRRGALLADDFPRR